MESAVNNDTKKCPHYQKNKCDCPSSSLKSLQAKSNSFQKTAFQKTENKSSKTKKESCDAKTCTKWKEKLNFFCQDKAEKKRKNKSTDTKQSEPNIKLESKIEAGEIDNIVSTSNNKPTALRGKMK